MKIICQIFVIYAILLMFWWFIINLFLLMSYIIIKKNNNKFTLKLTEWVFWEILVGSFFLTNFNIFLVSLIWFERPKETSKSPRIFFYGKIIKM